MTEDERRALYQKIAEGDCVVLTCYLPRHRKRLTAKQKARVASKSALAKAAKTLN